MDDSRVPAPVLLEVDGLVTHIRTSQGTVKPVDGISLCIRYGEAVALVGESACGKTMTAMTIMGLVREPIRIAGGRVLLKARDLLTLSGEQMRQVRGAEIAMVFQDPMTFLNPVFKVGDQIMEAVMVHQRVNRKEAKKQVLQALGQVRIHPPDIVFEYFPHQLSGGMRQRVLLAMAICCRPALIIADEPTTALDVTVQAQIMELFETVRREIGSSLLLITHDLGLVARYCDRVYVMYAGKILETGDIFSLFEKPRHPYTQGLLGCCVRPDLRPTRFATIEGQVPNLISPPSGCRFHPRCPHTMEICRREPPPFFELNGQGAACWLHGEATLTAERSI
jgi:oligopeptide/dipeptide ABC transporter ATP-binding protein